MKRIILIAVTFLFVFFASACAAGKDIMSKSSGDTAESIDTEALTTENTESFRRLTLAGNSLEDYTVVYAVSPYADISQELEITTDFDYQSAVKLQTILKEYTGVDLPIIADDERTETDKEIRIGKTDRTTYEITNEFGYRISLDEGSLTICGSDYGVTWHAVDVFLEAFISGDDVVLEDGYISEGSYTLTKIACIGDSITYGEHNRMRSYPDFLGFLLWQDYKVNNYGNSGATMRSDLATPYCNTNAFSDCKEAQADIYLLMLGTNDSYWDPQWKEIDNQRFIDSCIEIVENVNSDKKSRVYILNCPVYYGTSKYASEQVRKLQAQIPEVLENLGYTVEFFDMYSFTKDSLTESYFPDQLHPTSEGYRIIAEELYKLFIKN